MIAGAARRTLPATLAALALAACGGTGGASTTSAARAILRGACTRRALATLARATGIGAGAIAARPFEEADGSQACRWGAARSAGGPLALTVDRDGAPQAYEHFNREVVEYGQGVIWFHRGSHAAPQAIIGLGLAADWFPARRQLLSTDGTIIVAVTVRSAPARTGGREPLARALARR